MKHAVISNLPCLVAGLALLLPSASQGQVPGEVAPFGRVRLVDEIDLASDGATHAFAEYPAGASRVETILGAPARVVPMQASEASYVAYRIGRGKGLKAGGAYVLAVEYPEDAPRSIMVVNTGNETSRGFHTGTTVGDSLRAKYVGNHCESLDIPLSGKWEQWTLLVQLHDRSSAKGLERGGMSRPLKPADGFDVVLSQYSAPNDPLSQGIAARRIRLYEVLDPAALAMPLRLPPNGLPRRHIFWREEMADGVVGDKDKTIEQRGLDDPLDWYRHKAALSRFLGINTFSKDLLEFGACQHWDSTPYGGHDWVYHDPVNKGLWAQIVEVMGQNGLNVLPYYEYSGSKGAHGLGPQRRAKPLTRDDAYTHIKWIESANADITDPDTYEDFRKMLELTIVRLKGKAQFVGAWIRPRSQLPVGFGDATRGRFATEANNGQAVTREQLRADKALYGRYLDWWHGKRREFLTAMRDYLRSEGVEDAMVLFTGCAAEPGVGFADWGGRFVTDQPDLWGPLLAKPPHTADGKQPPTLLTPTGVAARNLYLEGLLSPSLSWGGWENQHANPADDPQGYRDVDGVMLTHAFNRLYTVASSATFDAYRTRSGLAVVRHYGLNENMMIDANDKSILGYFVADVERAGPYCMQSEAVAVANGDPTMIGYLVGSNFGRGFPQYVRDFNLNYLALPALGSEPLAGASSDPEVVVRAIRTTGNGTFLAIVNTGVASKAGVRVRLPAAGGAVTALASGRVLQPEGGTLTLTLRPCQLVSVGIGVR
jgi:hypothetical protein